MTWTLLITLIVLAVAVLIGHAEHAHNDQMKQFNMECIDNGGRIEVLRDIGKVLCQKNN